MEETTTRPYLAIFEVLPFPALLLEPGGDGFKIVNANKKYCQLSGRNCEKIKGQVYPQISSKELFPEQHLKDKKACLKKAFLSGKPARTKCLRYDLDTTQKGENSVRFWQVENIPIKDEQGKVRFILNLAQDQTRQEIERRKTEEKLAQNREIQEHFIRKNPDGLYSLDREGNFTSLNEGIARLAEVSENELLHQSFIPFCAPKDRNLIMQHFNRAVQGENVVFEAAFLSAKGREMVLEISLVPIVGKNEISGV